MTCETDRLDGQTSYVQRPGIVDNVHRTGIGEQEVGAEGIERVGAAIEQRRLQDGVAEHCLFDSWCVDSCAGPFDQERVSTEVIGVTVGGDDGNDFRAEFFAGGLECLASGSVVQPGIDQDDVGVVEADHADVDSSRKQIGAI